MRRVRALSDRRRVRGKVMASCNAMAQSLGRIPHSMKTTYDVLLVKSAAPPSVEVDWDSQSVYVRFRRSRVLKTIARHRGSCFVTVDVDRLGQVVGVEAIGETRIEVGRILKRAGVEAPNVDFSRVRYVRPKNKGGKDAGLRAVNFRRRSGNMTDE